MRNPMMPFLPRAVLLLIACSASGQNHANRPEVVVDSFARAWNEHDIEGFGSVFAEDADWVTASGMRVKGRSEIQSVLAKEHASWAKTTSMAITAIYKRVIDRNVVLYFNWEISGAVDSEGTPVARYHGINLLVVTRRPTGWHVVAGQVTVIRNRTPPSERPGTYGIY